MADLAKKKPALELLIGVGGGKRGGGAEPKPEGEGGGDMEALGQELIDAVKADDAQGVADAVRAMCELCCSDMGSGGEEE